MDDAWDQRIARWMVRPLVGTWVTPNHLTTMRLLIGLVSLFGFTMGDYFWSNIAALGFALSNLIDHTDGELARMSGQSSEWGHYYDLGCDAIIHVFLFVCIGIGLTANMQNENGVAMGFIAGISVILVFWFRMKIEDHQGKLSVEQPRWAGFEMEDVMYLVPLVALLDGLNFFIVLGAAISPWVAFFFGWKYFRLAKN